MKGCVVDTICHVRPTLQGPLRPYAHSGRTYTFHEDTEGAYLAW